jgi:hypothetical protein
MEYVRITATDSDSQLHDEPKAGRTRHLSKYRTSAPLHYLPSSSYLSHFVFPDIPDSTVFTRALLA